MTATGTGYGIYATSSGTGAVSIDSFGSVTSASLGLYAKATGGVQVQNIGGLISVANSGGAASGVIVTSGAAVSVSFSDETISATTYRGDLTVKATGTGEASGAAIGVSVAGATGAVTVGFTGAGLSATGAGATGVSTSGGTTAAVTFAPNATTGDGSALTVSAAGGSAVGVSIAGASASETAVLGDTVNVTNSAGVATGVALSGGASQGVTLSKAATVVAAGGAAAGVFAAGAGSDVSVTAGGLLLVSNRAGSATGVTVGGGGNVTANLSAGLTVQATSGQAWGVSSNQTGAFSITATGAFSVTSANNSAIGILGDGGGSQTFILNNGMTVSAGGGTAYGVQSIQPAGNIQMTSQGLVSVSNSAGSATGIFAVNSGAATMVSLSSGLNVRAAGGPAYGISLAGATGAISITDTGAINVASTTYAYGIFAGGGTTQTFTLNSALTVSGGDANTAVGVQSEFASSDVNLTAAGLVKVTNSVGGALGVEISATTNETAALLSGLTVQAAAGGATGVSLSNGTTQTVVASGPVNVTAPGQATGVTLTNGSGGASATFGDVLNVTSTGAGATGVSEGMPAGASNAPSPGSLSVSFAKTATIQAAGGQAFGVYLVAGGFGNAGNEAVTASQDLSVTNSAGAATGIYVYHIYDGGPQSASVAGALTVNAAGNAYGIELLGSNGSTATASVGGILNISASVSGAVGALLETNGSESLTYSSAATVSGAGGNSFGAYLIGANFLPQQATFLDKLTVINTSGGAAYGVYMSQGAGSTVTLTKTLSVSTTGGGQVIGVDFDSIVENPTRFFGATLHNPTAIAVNSDTGAVTGVSATNLRGDFLIDGAGTITATSAGAAAGVITTGVTGTQTLTLGAVTATSTESTATGVGLSGVGETTYPSGAAKIAISLTDASTIAANSHASSGSGGAGVNLAVTGAAATIVVDLNAVATTGAATPGVVLQGANGLISGTINSITTSGANSPGLTVTGATAGAVNLTVGIAGSTPSGGVSTIGAGSDGIDITTSTGTATVTASTVEVSGAGSYGLSIQTTSTTTGGAVTLTTGAVTGSGAASLNAINVQTGVGAISVTTTGNTSAANADTIRLASTSGNVTAALGDGTTTTSSTGVALNISTGGLATVTLGYSATTAALAGKSWGLEVSAAGGLTATLSGTVGSTSGGAIDASGGATSITNKGTINGYMMLSNAGNTFTNVGTFNAFGGDTTFGGTSTFNNSGTFNVYPGAVSATTLNLKGLTTLNNSGTISLANGHTGNVLNLQGAAYTGSGGATLVLDVNLANTAVNGSAAQSADLLKVGAISGSTKLALNDIGAGLPGQFNLTGIPVVAGTSSTPNAFTLAASPIQKGFVEYMLRQQGADYDLYSVPSAAAFELVRMGTEAQRYWRRSGDVWADQILGSDFKQGGSVWVQAFGGGETNNSHPTYSFATPAFNNSPVLDVRDNFGGVQGGYDWGHGAFGLGFTGGYTEQDGKLKATGDTLTFKGENVGLYARFAMANGFFAQGMGKIDFYDIDFGFAVSAGSPGFNGKTYGLDLQAGYRATSGKLFVEPILGLSVTHTDLDGFSANVGGVAATYGGGDSAYGKAGVRAGWTSLSSRSWRLSPYVGADWEGEMSGRPHVTLGLGASSLTFEDAPEGGRARVELGVSGIGPSGFSAFGKVEGVAGANAAGASVRVGLAWRW